jgi:hypothetical protein
MLDMMNTGGPVFVIGSPRSGTSILTWCLGQHPNILPLEETTWFSHLALTLQACFEEGSARGARSQLSAMRIGRDQLFATVGEALSDMIVGQRGSYERAAAEARLSAGNPYPDLLVSRSPADPKKRWIDGTPEYSLSAYGLRLLFPDARFIHILRDVRAVVPSMMNMANIAGQHLVKNEEEAYLYWLRTVRGCVAAERAFGSHVVLRIRYRDLVASPAKTLRRCLEFLGEEYTADCPKPLTLKINSSNVPVDFDSVMSGTPDGLREEAGQLHDFLDAEEPAFPGSEAAVLELAGRFLDHAHYVAWAPGELERRLAAARLVEKADRTL